MLNNDLIYVFIDNDVPDTILENSIFIPYYSFNSLSNKLKNKIKNQNKYKLYTNSKIIQEKISENYNIELFDNKIKYKKKIKNNIFYKKYIPITLSFFIIYFFTIFINYCFNDFFNILSNITYLNFFKNLIFFVFFLFFYFIFFKILNQKIKNITYKIL